MSIPGPSFFLLLTKSHYRQSGGLFSLLYFVALVMFFPFVFPVEATQNRQLMFGLILISLILMQFSHCERYFSDFIRSGQVDWQLHEASPFSWILFLSVTAMWTSLILPPILMGSLFLYLQFSSIKFSLASLILLSMSSWSSLNICTLTAGFSAHLNRSGPLLILLALPMLMPLFIFATNAISVVDETGNWIRLSQDLSIYLLASSMLLSTLIPLVILPIVLKIHRE